MTSPTQRAGADVQPVACDVVSIDGGIVAQRVSIAYANEMLLALEWEGCSKANFVYSESDYAALQARIAELEARNAASERDAARMKAVADNYWRIDCHSAPTGADDFDVYWTVSEYRGEDAHVIATHYADDPRAAIDAAIDAHAQGQAGEEKDG